MAEETNPSAAPAADSTQPADQRPAGGPGCPPPDGKRPPEPPKDANGRPLPPPDGKRPPEPPQDGGPNGPQSDSQSAPAQDDKQQA